MKKLILTLCALTALVSAAYAGTETYSSKEMKQTQTPCPQWYADNEFNVGVSAVFAPFTDPRNNNNNFGNDGSDWGFGGAMDIKYFFHRYYGIGIQGFGLALDNNDNNNFRRFNNNNNNGAAGGVLGTFTFRYPIPCSRWSPYGWFGAGAVWGLGNNNDFFVPVNEGFVAIGNNNNDDARFIAQGGIGIEYRFTPHIGWTNDVSYNYVDGSHNDFFQIRTGLNFAF